MILERYDQSDGRWCQILALRRAWKNFRSDVQYHRWSSNNSVGSGVIMLEKHWLLSNKSDWFVLPISSGTYCQSARQILCLWSCTVCLDPENCVHAVSSRTLSPEFFLSGRSRVTIFKRPAFQFWVIVTHQTRHLWQCCTEHHYPHFCNKQVIADMFPVLLCSFWVYTGQHPSSTLCCNPTCSNLIDTSYTNLEHIQYGSLRNSLIFLNNLVQIVSCTAWPSRLQLVVQVQIPIIIPLPRKANNH
jgi:hypothetical protein